MRLLATNKRLNKCLRKHVSNPGESWGVLLGQTVAQIRGAFRTGQDFAGFEANQVRDLLSRRLAEQMTLSENRPLYATFRKRPVNANRVPVGRGRDVIHFITPAKVWLICEAREDQHCLLITAFIPVRGLSWKDAARRLLDKYCRVNGTNYQIPTGPRTIREKLDGFQRDVEVVDFELHIPKHFGIRKNRGTRRERYNPPAWPEAKPYETKTEQGGQRFAPRPKLRPIDQPLKGGLEP